LTVENILTPDLAPAAALDVVPAEPVVAPAAPVAPAEDITYEHEMTGNPSLDVALDFIGQRGLSPTDPAVIAAKAGDFGPIEEKFKAMGAKAKGYERHLTLVKSVRDGEIASNKARDAALQTLVDKAAGGNARWEAIKVWAGTEADDGQKRQINAALTAGGMAATSVVEKLSAMYDRAVGKSPASAVKPGAAAEDGASNVPLTAKEYGKAVEKLMQAANGRDIGKNPAYIELQSRRLAARNAGVA